MVGSSGAIKRRIYERYKIIGFISSGTYGRVYKAQGRNGQTAEFAIKKYVVSSLIEAVTNDGMNADSSLTRKAR